MLQKAPNRGWGARTAFAASLSTSPAQARLGQAQCEGDRQTLPASIKNRPSQGRCSSGHNSFSHRRLSPSSCCVTSRRTTAAAVRQGRYREHSVFPEPSRGNRRCCQAPRRVALTVSSVAARRCRATRALTRPLSRSRLLSLIVSRSVGGTALVWLRSASFADGDAQPLLFSRSLSLSDSLPPLFCTRTHTHTAHTRTHNCPALSPLLHSSLFRRVSQRHCVQTAPAGMCERRAPTHPSPLVLFPVQRSPRFPLPAPRPPQQLPLSRA